jgi:hypothetical protein
MSFKSSNLPGRNLGSYRMSAAVAPSKRNQQSWKLPHSKADSPGETTTLVSRHSEPESQADRCRRNETTVKDLKNRLQQMQCALEAYQPLGRSNIFRTTEDPKNKTRKSVSIVLG